MFYNFSNKIDVEFLNSKLKTGYSLTDKFDSGYPVVAIETAILTHGMPFEYGMNFIKSVFRVCRKSSVSPAFLSVINGVFNTGTSEKDLLTFINSSGLKKISLQNMGLAMALKWSGGTTVSAGIVMASRAGIPVFCTGGIGGVHRGFVESLDVSQDLFSLSKTPVIVITAGAKAVLDLTKTYEALEFFGIPVIGYRTEEFPSFWSRNSGISLEATVGSPEEVVSVWKHHINSGNRSALVVANPVPEKDQIPYSEISGAIDSAVNKARESGVSGPGLTPFLLQFLNEKTNGRCLKTNLSLAINNVELGSAVSRVL